MADVEVRVNDMIGVPESIGHGIRRYRLFRSMRSAGIKRGDMKEEKYSSLFLFPRAMSLTWGTMRVSVRGPRDCFGLKEGFEPHCGGDRHDAVNY